MKVKKLLLSTKMHKNAPDWTSLILRVSFGILMIPHGWMKIQHFDAIINKGFVSFLGLSPSISLSLAIFAELICSALIIIGLFTRLATIPLVVTSFVIMSTVNNFKVIGENDISLAIMAAFSVILILGPGKYSLDNLLSK